MSPITIYPGSDAYYYSYYLRGFCDALPQPAFAFSAQSFPRFRYPCLALILGGRRIYISGEDAPRVREDGLSWCDVYAKVNLELGQSNQKLIAIGPSFGIRFLPLPRALWWAIGSYLRGAWAQVPTREHFAGYWRQWQYRLPLEAYRPGKVETDYAFFISSLWKKEPETNLFRANFVRTCLCTPGLRFEGGLIRRADVDGFSDVVIPDRVTYEDYLAKTQASLVAFNTPAVCGCHGWKLGEFLALGKAIVSTPLHRALPAPLEHGIHLHYVDGSVESIREALDVLRSQPNYRMALERAARDYYDTYLAPAAVVKRILARAEENRSRANA